MVKTIFKGIAFLFFILMSFSLVLIIFHYTDESYSFDYVRFITELQQVGNQVSVSTKDFIDSLKFFNVYLENIRIAFDTNSVAEGITGVLFLLPMFLIGGIKSFAMFCIMSFKYIIAFSSLLQI